MKSSTSIIQYTFLALFLFAPFVCAETPIFEGDLSGIKSDIALMKQNLDQLNSKAGVKEKKKEEGFCASYENVKAKFGGKYTQEAFVGRYLNLLNHSIQNDASFFVRTTVDYFMDFTFGVESRPRVVLHDTFRFRYRWGSGTEVRVEDGLVKIVDTNVSTKGTQASKHLLWSREAWMKIAIGNLDNPHEHFFQLGLLPYQVGRGISLGPAYLAGGFLGFTPGFSVDQFAPAALLHINPVPEKVSVELYVALLENFHNSFKRNEEVIRANEINGCPKRGTGRYSYLTVVRSIVDAWKGDDHSLFLEPYIIYLQANDQKLEFANDTDTFLTTFGMAIEGQKGKFDWGIEGAVNHGNAIIKSWDRNEIGLERNSSGTLQECYTKVFSDDPSTTTSPAKAVVTDTNKAAVSGSSKQPSQNGQEIGSTGVYNSFDRFRPEQERHFDGFFVIGDFSYQCIEDVLKVSFGAGYSSGGIDPQSDVNTLSNAELMSQSVSSFIPIQSVYSGKRLRHLIFFNEGVPRFNRKNPNATFTNKNVTPAPSGENLEFSNIAFAGTKVSWNVESLKDYKFSIAPNLIFYWAPETPDAIIDPSRQARNFLGTELVAEVSAVICKKIKLYGYGGAAFPGSYYTDMAGTVINTKEPNQTTCDDVTFIANIGMSFAF